MHVNWSPRQEPLPPTAMMAVGDAGRALAGALLRRADEQLVGLRGVQAADGSLPVLLILGKREQLPWTEGAIYLGHDPAVPGLLLPTALAPSVPTGLLAQALACVRLSAVAPHGKNVYVVEVDGALSLERESLERWLAQPGGDAVAGRRKA